MKALSIQAMIGLSLVVALMPAVAMEEYNQTPRQELLNKLPPIQQQQQWIQPDPEPEPELEGYPADSLVGPVFPGLRHLAVDSAGRVYAAGQGVIAVQDPGDTSFRVEHFQPGEEWLALGLSAQGAPMAVGGGGLVRRRAPDARWPRLPTPVGDDLRAITQGAGGEHWIVGDAGVILREKDGLVSLWRRPVRHSFRAIARNGDNGFWVAGEGVLLRIFRGVDYNTRNATWAWDTLMRAESLYGIHFPEPHVGYAVGADGAILKKAGEAEPWRRIDAGVTDTLFAVRFSAEGEGWVAGSGGLLLHSRDGGETWERGSREMDEKGARRESAPYYSLPAPWYFLSALIMLALLAPMLRRPRNQAEESVSTHLMADRPLEHGDPDPMNFESLALGVSLFLRNRETDPPLTMAVAGEWGKGKSSLMNLLRTDLDRNRFPTVWFNAWHHQTQEHILAALLSNIRAQAVPSWFSTQGWVFRLRLLWLRIQRMRGPVSVVLALAALLVGYLLGYPRQTGEALSSLSELTGMLLELDFGRMMDTWRELPNAPMGALLALFLLGGGLLWRLLPVFGVRPATLMAGLKTNLPSRELNRLAGFRFQFATEFREFTKAMGRHNLVILIDDMDRCNPEYVLDVMESVNFLTSCGKCVVVMGMDMEFVQSCIGLGFREVAEEQNQLRQLKERYQHERPLGDAEPEWEGAVIPTRELSGPVMATAFEQRNHFATKYLEKLINIRIPLPTPRQDQFFRIILPEELERARIRKITLKLEKALPSIGKFLLLGAFIWFLGREAYRYGPELVSDLVRESEDIGGTPAEAQPEAGQPGEPVPEAADAPDPQAEEGPTRIRWRTEAPRIQLPQPADTWDWGPLALFALVASLGIVGAALKPEEVVRDSRQFRKALELWSALIYLSNRTPRAIKRFLNRVRYLAMQQRAHVGEVTWLQRLASWLLKRFPRTESAVEAADAPLTTGDGREDIIPENVLVGLCALEHMAPREMDALSRQESASPEKLIELIQGRLSQKNQDALAEEIRRAGFHRHLSRFRALTHGSGI